MYNKIQYYNNVMCIYIYIYIYYNVFKNAIVKLYINIQCNVYVYIYICIVSWIAYRTAIGLHPCWHHHGAGAAQSPHGP